MNNLLIEPVNKNLKKSFVAIYIEGGSVLDKKPGMSHLIEHMHFSAGKYLLDAYNIQANYNAYTSTDCICYYMTVSNDNIYKAIKLIMKTINNFKITRKNLIDENRIILEEQKIRNDKPQLWLYNQSLKSIYRELQKTLIDIPYTIPFYNIAEVRDYYEKTYTISNMNLVISSAVPKSKLEKYIKKIKMHKLKDCEIQKPLPFIINTSENNSKTKYFVYNRKFSKKYIIINFQIPYDSAISLKIILSRSLLIFILGEGNFSELFNYLRLKKKLVYGISSSLDITKYYSIVTIHLSVSKYRHKAMYHIYKVLSNIMKGKLQVSFNVHKKNLLDNLINNINKDNSTLVITLYDIYRLYNIATNYNELMKIYKEITLHDIIEEAKKIFVFDSRCSVHYTK